MADRTSSAGGPTLVKRRSSRLSQAAPYALPRQNTTGLSGAMGAMGVSDDAPDPKPQRRSSNSNITANSSRAMFAKMDADAAKPKRSDKEVVQKAKFDNKVNMFQQGGPAAAKGKKASVTDKLAAFEEKAKAPEPTAKKTWKVQAGRTAQRTTEFKDGPAKKKTLADLP